MRRIAKHPSSGPVGVGVIEGAVFALAGLMIAFTFAGGSARFDLRRQLIVSEANQIRTAYSYIDLLSENAQPDMRNLFRSYLDSRLEVYRKLPDFEAAKAELLISDEIQQKIWTSSVAATSVQGGHPDAAKLLLPSVNQMIDITSTRTMAAYTHPPTVIYGLLFLVTFGASMLAGFSMAPNEKRNWVHIGVFILTMGICLFVILDLEFPRTGFINLSSYDDVLIQLRKNMD